ncbi:hypothetical protein [Streptosporangium sp. NPDC004631]
MTNPTTGVAREATGHTPDTTGVLNAAADALAALRHARVCTVDVTRTIHQAAIDLLPADRSGAYRLACRSLDVLVAHRSATGEDPAALDRWTDMFGRDAMAEQMRAAAQATAGQAVASC